MLTWRPLAAATLAAALALASVAAPAQQVAAIDPVTRMPLPLLPGEAVFRFKNGCGYVVPAEQIDATLKQGPSKTSWYGACKFGLADGPGYFTFEGIDYKAIGWKSPYRAAKAHLGNFEPDSSDPDTSSLSGALNAGASETVKAIDSLVPPPGSMREKFESFSSILTRNGTFGFLNLASRSRSANGHYEGEMLDINKQDCPSTDRSKTEKWLLDGTTISVALTAAQAKTIAQFCNQAIERLKQEGRISGNNSVFWPVSLFNDVDYGYFFIVYVQHDVRTTSADGTETVVKLPRKAEYTNVTLCPQLDSLASCEPVWRALQQPYIERREELRNIARNAELAARKERKIRFAPLEAAWRAKAKEIAAR